FRIRLWRPPMEQQPYHAIPKEPGPQNTKHCGSTAATATMRALPSIAGGSFHRAIQ
ncbi:hypothetical protein MMC31_006565, partial [Peltigera leucophlebia]|nr:hypothetical protein [Peltigera leucophlebia]